MALKVPTDNLVIEDAQITYRNFAGAEGQFNPAGARSFSVQIGSIEEAEALADLGWKVKIKKPREDGEDHQYPATLPVALKYHPKVQPPRVKMITSRGQTTLDEESIDMLDFMSIGKVDLIIRPFHWKMSSGEGVKNMLVSIYVTIREDELELKYADVPEIEMVRGGQQREIESSEVWDAELVDLGEVETQKALSAGF